jgi:hypothetical protein
MARIKELFSLTLNPDEWAFPASTLMSEYITDLDSIEYAFMNVNAFEQVSKDIQDLRRHSYAAIANLFERFSIGVNEDKWFDTVMGILFPFLLNQFEVRTQLLAVYWERMKAQNYRTANPDFEAMGSDIASLASLIQECGDMDVGEVMTSIEGRRAEPVLLSA